MENKSQRKRQQENSQNKFENGKLWLTECISLCNLILSILNFNTIYLIFTIDL